MIGIAAMLAALAGVQVAAAQTVASLKIVDGDGQAPSYGTGATLGGFQPIVVQALDASGHAVANATITWATTSGQATVSSPTTVTDANGMSSNPLSSNTTLVYGTTAIPYLASTIKASANGGNASVTFYETYALVDPFSNPMVSGQAPIQNGSALPATLPAAATGSTLSPIQIFVAGEGTASNGVSGVSVELRIPAGQTNPTITCAPSASTGNPGTVLSGTYVVGSNPPYNTICTPVIGGSGTGQFYIMVGGVDNLTTPAGGGPGYLQQFGPYTFTSTPGAATSVNLIQGNNQVLSPGQSLGTLIAQVVDAKGNPVQNANVTWSDNPVNAFVLSGASTTTDNNGEVTVSGGLSGASEGICTVTVALTNNPSISGTFTETSLVSIKSLAKVSGDGQTAKVGTAFTQPLVVQVNGNNGTLANYPVQVSLSGPATLGSSTVVTNSSGQAQIFVTAGSTTGPVTVTASVGGASQSFTLTVTPAGPTPNGIIKVSGDGQFAVVGTNFAAPLIVQVNSSAGAVGNYTVQFSFAGPITISSSSGITNSAGQTEVTVTAGTTTGSASVTASIPGYSVTFNLTVNPPGPTLTAASFANGASGQSGFISPCGLATITATGLAPNGASSLFAQPIFGPLPTSVNGMTVNFNNFLAPIFSATLVGGQPQLLVQVPCEVQPATNVPVTVNVGAGSSMVNVPVQTVAPGIFQTTYSDGAVRAVALRADGSFVSLANPARRGEIVRIYVTGLGVTAPSVGTGQVDNPGADLLGDDAQATGLVVVGMSQVGGATVTSARLGANMIGVFEVAFIVPQNAPQGNDITISVGVVPAGSPSGAPTVNSLGSKLPID